MSCTQCQGWRMRTSTSSIDYCVTFLCVEHRIVLVFVRVSAFCTEIFYRSSRFVKPEEDIWISGFTSYTNTGLLISAYYRSVEYFVPEKQPGDGKPSALCGALFQLSWWILIPFPCCPRVIPRHPDGNGMHCRGESVFRDLIGTSRSTPCKTDHPSYIYHSVPLRWKT